MAVEQARVTDRFNELFGTVAVSNTRRDGMTAKIGLKLPDGATDEQIDAEINGLNEIYPFQEMKRNDDRIQNDKNNPPKKVVAQPENQNPQTNPEPDPMALMLKTIQDLAAEVKGFKEEKTKETISSKFANDKRIKDIPAIIRKGFMPTSEDDYESNVESLLAEYKPFAEKHKLQDMGNDNPASSTDTTAAGGKVKQISKAEAEKIADGL